MDMQNNKPKLGYIKLKNHSTVKTTTRLFSFFFAYFFLYNNVLHTAIDNRDN